MSLLKRLQLLLTRRFSRPYLYRHKEIKWKFVSNILYSMSIYLSICGGIVLNINHRHGVIDMLTTQAKRNFLKQIFASGITFQILHKYAKDICKWFPVSVVRIFLFYFCKILMTNLIEYDLHLYICGIEKLLSINRRCTFSLS
jgi:hypothetical protein